MAKERIGIEDDLRAWADTLRVLATLQEALVAVRERQRRMKSHE